MLGEIGLRFYVTSATSTQNKPELKYISLLSLAQYKHVAECIWSIETVRGFHLQYLSEKKNTAQIPSMKKAFEDPPRLLLKYSFPQHAE